MEHTGLESSPVEFRGHHVSLSVSDLGESTAFYSKLGFEEAYAYSSADGSKKMAHLHLGSFVLELFEMAPYFEYSSPSNRDIRPIGIRHFALQVESIDVAYGKLISAGFECEKVATGLSGLKYFFVQDPDGIWFEVVEDNRVRIVVCKEKI